MKKLFVGSLSFRTTHEDLEDLFGSIAEISSVHIVSDRVNGRPSAGFGFIEIVNDSDISRVIDATNGIKLGGRAIIVNEARPREERKPIVNDEKQNNVNEIRFSYEDSKIAELPCDKRIIEVSNIVSIELFKFLKENPHALKSIDRRLFEKLIAEIFHEFGFTVELTKRTRDGGVDIIAIHDDLVRTQYLIECKRPNPGNLVGIQPVRELYGVFCSKGATKAIMATTARFSKDATIFFHDHEWQIEGKDFDGVYHWIAQYVTNKSL